MREIRLHGLGGQGAVIACQILAVALANEGWHVAAFPQFGAERRGSLVAAFLRFDDKPIRQKCLVYYPDAVLVLDDKQIHSPTTYKGIKSDSVMVANSPSPLSHTLSPNLALAGWVDATKLALDVLHRPIVNTCLVGAFAGATQWVKLNSVVDALPDFFDGRMLERNTRCVQLGYEKVRISRKDDSIVDSVEA